MKFDDNLKPKHINQVINQYKTQFIHPKSQKLIKEHLNFTTQYNKSFGVNSSNLEDELNQQYNSYIISLAQYEQRKSIDSNRKSLEEPSSRGSYNSQTQKNKRNLIYGNQSFKQTSEDLNETTIESNNQIFQMVFFNKNEQSLKIKTQNIDTNITSTAVTSFSKIKSMLKATIKKQQTGEEEAQGAQDDFNIKIEDFSLGKKLGAGKFGQVFIARHKQSGFICAIKRIIKDNIDQKLLIQLIREIKIQTFLNNPNIVKLYTFFSDQQFIYFVLELCYSGQLYNFLKKERKLNEPLTKNVIQQSLKALDYMHENQIIHRDIKPENIIFQCGLIKLCDFGWSISSKTMRETFCGTPLYVSPQLLKRKNYNNKIDVWSIGILTYELLFGKVPFDITTQRDFIKIAEDEIKFSKATKISDSAKDFILICLKKDPRQRYTVPELLEHPFIQNQQPVSIADMY